MKTILVLILFATIGFAEDASACSCGDTPFENELRIGNGVIPENARGLGWHFTRAEQAGALEEIVEVTRLDQPALDDGFVIEPIGFPSGIFTDNEIATVFAIRPNEWEGHGLKFRRCSSPRSPTPIIVILREEFLKSGTPPVVSARSLGFGNAHRKNPTQRTQLIL